MSTFQRELSAAATYRTDRATPESAIRLRMPRRSMCETLGILVNRRLNRSVPESLVSSTHIIIAL